MTLEMTEVGHCWNSDLLVFGVSVAISEQSLSVLKQVNLLMLHLHPGAAHQLLMSD